MNERIQTVTQWIDEAQRVVVLTGALHDVTGSYSSAFWIAISCCGLSAWAIWRAAPRKVRAVAGRVRQQG